MFMHPTRAHLNLHSSWLLPPLAIWPHVRSGLILFALAEITAHLSPPSLSPSLGDQRGSGELDEKANTDTLERVLSGHPTPTPPHPYCMPTVLRQQSEGAFQLQPFARAEPDFLFPSALHDILSSLLLSHFLILCMRSPVLPGNGGRDVARQVQYVVNSFLLVSVSKACACVCMCVCVHTHSVGYLNESFSYCLPRWCVYAQHWCSVAVDTSPSNTHAPDFPLTNLNLVQSEAGRYSQGKKEAVELGTLPPRVLNCF